LSAEEKKYLGLGGPTWQTGHPPPKPAFRPSHLQLQRLAQGVERETALYHCLKCSAVFFDPDRFSVNRS